MCRVCENHIKFIWNWVMRLCSHGKHTQKATLGPLAYSWAKRRALYSTLLSTTVFHALQHILKLWISDNRRWVSNTVSAPYPHLRHPPTNWELRLTIAHLGPDTIWLAPWRGIHVIFYNLMRQPQWGTKINSCIIKWGKVINLYTNIQASWNVAES